MTIRKVFINLSALIVVFVFLFPVIWILLSSFKPASELFRVPLTLFPENWTSQNYLSAWYHTDFLLYFGNTMFIAIVSTILLVFISTMCGYSLAKYKYKWLNVVFICILSTQMLPTEVIMNPLLQVIRRLGLVNSLWGVILPSLGNPTAVFMMRQYFLTIPDEIIESARLEGASEFQIFTRLMIPLARPAIAALAIFSMRWRWNSYLTPLLVLTNPSRWTLQIGLRNLIGAENIEWHIVLPSALLSMIPMIIIFVLFQKQVLGIDLTSGGKG